MEAIGIVGTGISGLQLALYLQAQGVGTTLYSPRSIDEHRGGRLPNCVMRWAPTVQRERALDVYHRAENEVEAIHVRIAGEPDLVFCGRLPGPANTTDFRLYLPDLLEDYQARGGAVVVGPCGPEDVLRLALRHELLVVAAGRDGYGGLFPPDPARSRHRAPPRHLTAGLYRGISWPEPSGVEFTIVPGMGEIFQVCFHSFDGPVSAVTVEGMPGTPLAELCERDHAAGPHAFQAAVLDVLDTFAPALFERIDHSSFALTGPLDLLQGRIGPVVRRSWARLSESRMALAIGDAWILNDPIAAQGANLGSRCAFVLGAAIAAGGPYDESFCRRAEQQMWAAAEAPTILSNALLEPPTPAAQDILFGASRDQTVADRFAAGFGEPEALLAMLTGGRVAV